MQALRAFLNKEHSLLNSLKEIADPQGRFADKSREATSLDDGFVGSWDDSREGGNWHTSLQVGLALSIRRPKAPEHPLHIIVEIKLALTLVKMTAVNLFEQTRVGVSTYLQTLTFSPTLCWLHGSTSPHVAPHAQSKNITMHKFFLSSSGFFSSCVCSGCVWQLKARCMMYSSVLK